LPPPPEQRAIAYILGTLDDKIELNRRISEKLEAIARAIFKSWFVDFDPVRSKAERRDPGLPKRIAELFPDDLVGSELGDVPDGWEIERFGELTAVLLGGTPRTAVDEYWNGGVPWAAARDLTQAHSPFVLRTERTISEDGIENSNAKLLPQWTTVVTARGTVGVIRLLGRPMAINQTSYALLPRSQAGPLYIFFCLHALLDEIRQRTYGTVFDTITTRTLADLHIVRPPSALMDAFEAVAMPFMARLLGAALESEVIASLRDSLLPKLISGELRVSDPDRLLGEVV
jgi:type I restriction enzyme S subunit